MYVNQTGLGQVTRIPPGARVLRVPRLRRRGMGQACPPGENLTLAAGMQTPTCVPTLAALQAQTTAEETSQFMTSAAIANQNAVAAAGLPANLGPGWTGLTNAQQTALTYCGDYPTAPECAGQTQAQILAANVGPNVAGNLPLSTPASTIISAGGSGGGVPMTAVALTAATPATATLVNTSRPGQSPQVGDSWQLTITGAPNSPVTDSATQNGTSLGTTPYGSTDANGNFSLSGTFDSSSIGTWVETWSVGGSQASPISFTVAAAPAGTAASTALTTTTTPVSTAITGTCWSPLASFGIPDTCVGPIGIAELVAGVVGLFLISSMFGGRK